MLFICPFHPRMCQAQIFCFHSSLCCWGFFKFILHHLLLLWMLQYFTNLESIWFIFHCEVCFTLWDCETRWLSCVQLVFWCGSIQQSQKIFPRQTNIILASSHKPPALLEKISNGNPCHLQQNIFLLAFPKADSNNGPIISGMKNSLQGRAMQIRTLESWTQPGKI